MLIVRKYMQSSEELAGYCLLLVFGTEARQ